ncbi:hypothetical protein TNCT_733831, partial [Trichonephila clavata]
DDKFKTSRFKNVSSCHVEEFIIPYSLTWTIFGISRSEIFTFCVLGSKSPEKKTAS